MQDKGFTLLELMVVVAMIGIILSMALPRYQDYAVKTRVVEGLQLATAAKLAVAEAVARENTLPKSQEEAEYTPISPTANVANITIGQQGVITIQYTPSAGAGTILIKPTLANGDLSWDCKQGTLAAKYRPQACR